LSTSLRLYDAVDKKREEKISHKKLETHPESVSTSSSQVPVVGPTTEALAGDRDDPDMLAGVRADLKTIRATIALGDVPKEPLYIGLAGVLPYLATSMSTLYLAWDINYAASHGSGLLVSGETAEWLLRALEPIQIGYGAVMLSFLGAIHWGLEWAGYGGYQTYRRYAIGVLSTAFAWPTTFLPMQYALISQFIGFTFLYFADARAAKFGWAPPWYGTYRFILTFIVGASIVASLIGRGRIGDKVAGTTSWESPTDRMKALRDAQWEALEQEEHDRLKRLEEEDAEGNK
jgi:hypothetical protein